MKGLYLVGLLVPAVVVACGDSGSSASSTGSTSSTTGVGGTSGTGGPASNATSGTSTSGSMQTTAGGSASGGSGATTESSGAGGSGTGGSSSTTDSGTGGTTSTTDSGTGGTTSTTDSGTGGTTSSTDSGTGGTTSTTDSGTGGTTGTAGAAGEMGAGGEGGDVGASPVLLEYMFEESSGATVLDSSGRGLDGTLSDAAARGAGRNGSGISLGGGIPPAQYLDIPSGVFTGVSDYTVSAWVNIRADVPWSRLFDFGNGLGGAENRFAFLSPFSNDGIRYSYFSGAGPSEVILTTGPGVFPLNVWKHISMVAAGSRHTLYVDGFPAAQGDSFAIPASELEPLAPQSWLGKSRFGADGGLDGLIDEFIIHDYALSREEVAELAYPGMDYSEWRFDEGSGTTASDTSDRAIGATLDLGATWTTGRLGSAVDLPGTDEYVTFTSDPLGGCNSEFTIAVWIKLGAAVAWTRVFDFGASNWSSFVYLTPRNHLNQTQFALFTPSGETQLLSDTLIPTDAQWHHIAVTASSTNASMYLDGALIASNDAPAGIPANLTPLDASWLGKSRFPDAYLTAGLDELRISCRAYSATEIAYLSFQ